MDKAETDVAGRQLVYLGLYAGVQLAENRHLQLSGLTPDIFPAWSTGLKIPAD